MKDLSLWKFVCEKLEQSVPVSLMVVAESSGSSPGRQGFKMAVTSDGMHGSIGGGVMEHKFVELAKEKLNSGDLQSIVRKQFHNKTAIKDQSGMICSGEQTLLILKLIEEDIPEIRKIILTLEQFQSGVLEIRPGKFQLLKSGEVGFEPHESNWKYREQLGFKNHIHIVGGGHCSLAFSQLMSTLDFYIHVYEDRRELNTFLGNHFAHEKVLLNDYSELDKHIASGQGNYIVVMTFGYRTDDIAVRTIIKIDYKYFGVLGSKAKMEKLLSEWRRDGLPADKINSLKTPVGIPIHSQTPVEIAISIAAEIIAVKNRPV